MAKVGSWLGCGTIALLVGGCGGASANGGTGGTGGTGSRGDAGSETTAGSASGGGATLECQEVTPEPCECGRSDPDCLVLSDAIQACGLLDAPVPTACAEPTGNFNPYPDECACEGRTCAAGQTCRRIFETVSGGSYYRNRCYIVCSGDGDCAAGEACFPNRFGVPVCSVLECRNDADCTEDPCGRCVRHEWQGFQGATWRALPLCVYQGAPTGGLCDSGGPSEGPVRYPPPSSLRGTPPVHVCHPGDPAWD